MITEPKKRDVALVVDDSPETLRLLTDALDGAGMTVMVARIRVHLANARMTQSARAALDASGRYLLAVSRQGKILWATPQAQKLLSATLTANADDEFLLPEPMPQWLEQVQKGKAASKAALAPFTGNEQLRLQYMGKLGPNEFLLRLAKDSSTEAPAEFSSELGLTIREGEVLS